MEAILDFFYQYDFLIIIGLLIVSLFAQMQVQRAFQKYQKAGTTSSLTGAQAARKMLSDNGVDDVVVVKGKGMLTDHYNPSTRTIALSPAVYDNASISSVSIACHEAGHALQHAQGYFFITIRNMILPVTLVANQFAFVAIFIGLFFQMTGLFAVGIVLFGVIALFQLLTLPLEFNASKRAIRYMENGVLEIDEVSGASKVLRAAAFTYVVALLTSVAQLLRLLAIFDRR